MIFMIPIAPLGSRGSMPTRHGMVPMAYLVGMLAMLFTALSYGAMAKAFPIAGSVYSYAQRGIHPHVGLSPAGAAARLPADPAAALSCSARWR